MQNPNNICMLEFPPSRHALRPLGQKIFSPRQNLLLSSGRKEPLTAVRASDQTVPQTLPRTVRQPVDQNLRQALRQTVGQAVRRTAGLALVLALGLTLTEQGAVLAAERMGHPAAAAHMPQGQQQSRDFNAQRHRAQAPQQNDAGVVINGDVYGSSINAPRNSVDRGFAGTWRDPETGDIITSVIAPRQPQPSQSQMPLLLSPQVYPQYPPQPQPLRPAVPVRPSRPAGGR